MAFNLPDDLAPIDSLADRWSRIDRVTGSLHPLEAIRLLHDGAVLGGGDAPLPHDIELFDQVYCAAPIVERKFIDVWYKERSPVTAKANRLGISRTSIYTKWREVLQYYRGQLHARGLRVGHAGDIMINSVAS